MASKVFLFGDDMWLYCTGVTLENGVYHAHVENGCWHLMYDTDLEAWFACQSRSHADSLVVVNKGKAKLRWACDPCTNSLDYNTVIEDAKQRYMYDEPANYVLTDSDYQRYLKLKAKYENQDDEYDLYLELRERFEEDEVPF
jgi:hypothetical protein